MKNLTRMTLILAAALLLAGCKACELAQRLEREAQDVYARASADHRALQMEMELTQTQLAIFEAEGKVAEAAAARRHITKLGREIGKIFLWVTRAREVLAAALRGVLAVCPRCTDSEAEGCVDEATEGLLARSSDPDVDWKDAKEIKAELEAIRAGLEGLTAASSR